MGFISGFKGLSKTNNFINPTKNSTLNFHTNAFGGIRDVLFGRTDGRTDTRKLKVALRNSFASSPLKKKKFPRNVYLLNFPMSTTHIENLQTTRNWRSSYCTAFNGCQKTPGFWGTALYQFVYRYRNSEGAFCLHFQYMRLTTLKMEAAKSTKCRQLYINQQDVTSQKAGIFICIPVKTCSTSRMEC